MKNYKIWPQTPTYAKAFFSKGWFSLGCFTNHWTRNISLIRLFNNENGKNQVYFPEFLSTPKKIPVHKLEKQFSF